MAKAGARSSSRGRQLSVETSKCRSGDEVLGRALGELGWKNVTAATVTKAVCDIYWRVIDSGDQVVPDKSYIARIPGMSSVSHKGELAKHLNRLRDLFPEDLDFYPHTWLLPDQQEEFESYAHKKKEAGKKTTYIVKPDEGSQGEGIFLIQNPRDLSHLRVPSVVQEYLPRPHLLRGLKFDLRIYVLVASLDPLELYLSRSGMARFCTVPYEAPSIKNLHRSFMHLTNYSLNKRSQQYEHSEEGDKGSKQTLSAVFKEMQAEGHHTEEVWRKIGEMVCKTVVAVLPQLMVERKAFCVENSVAEAPKGFQILGFDVLLDHRLRPLLLEVNAHPSLRVDFEQPVRPGVVEYIPSPVDLEIKLPVVKDTLSIIGSKISNAVCTPRDSSFEPLCPAGLEGLSHLRLYEHCAELYLQFVGVKGGLKMGSSAFRAFTRHCGLCDASFTNADVDILFIEVSRHHGNEKNSISFDGFCQALLSVAKRLHGSSSPASLRLLLDHCQGRLSGRGKAGQGT